MEIPIRALAGKALGWPKRFKLAHAFLWEYNCKRLELAQIPGQLGVFLALRVDPDSGPTPVDIRSEPELELTEADVIVADRRLAARLLKSAQVRKTPSWPLVPLYSLHTDNRAY